MVPKSLIAHSRSNEEISRLRNTPMFFLVCSYLRFLGLRRVKAFFLISLHYFSIPFFKSLKFPVAGNLNTGHFEANTVNAFGYFGYLFSTGKTFQAS